MFVQCLRPGELLRNCAEAPNILEVAVRQSASAGRTRSLTRRCGGLPPPFSLPVTRSVTASYSCSFFSWRPGFSVSTMFRASARLLDCRITFFTRSPCGLCDTAKAVVRSVETKRPLTYREVNVMEPGQEKWKSLYEFDTPVVSH
jgi:hypothetical protein